MSTTAIEQAMQNARRQHQAGQLAVAELLYRQVLAADPNHADALHMAGVIALQQNRHADAAEFIGRAIAARPRVADFHCNRGIALAALGRISEAMADYQCAIQLQADHLSAHVNLGIALVNAGKFMEAVHAYGRALTFNPDHPIAHNNLGIALMRMGDVDAALASYRRALALKADYVDAHYNLAIALGAKGSLDEAIAEYDQTIRLQPRHAAAHGNRAAVLLRQGKTDDAIAGYARAIELNPADADAWNNLANVLLDQRRLDEAIAAYQRAIALHPARAQSHGNLGIALTLRGRLDEAVAVCSTAVRLQPDFAQAHGNLGNALFEQGRLAEAANAYARAIALRPDSAEGHCNLGSVLFEQGKLDEAATACERAIQLNARLATAYNHLANVRREQFRLPDALASYDKALAVNPQDSTIDGNRLYSLHFDPQQSREAVYQEHRRWNRRHAEPLAAFAKPHGNLRDPNRRLKIGYVSPDFRAHPVGHLLLPLLQGHDHAVVEIFCYSDVRATDAMTQQLRRHADQWRNVAGLSDEKLAELIRQDQIDVLVDLAGHTTGNRLLVFARRPAPVLMTYLGYPDTTGMPAIDYRLTDSNADPPGLTDAFHAEQLCRLPETFLCLTPTDASMTVAPSPVRRRGYVTFGSFNTSAKLNPFVVGLWAEILRQTPGARMMIKCRSMASASARQRLLELFANRGIGVDRLDLRSITHSHLEHLRLYDDVDIALDTFPYHGTTTTCEALWMGAAVVTLAGPSHVSRVGVSILSSVGLGDLIARDPEQYVRLAVDLAHDSSRLQHLRAGMRERLAASPLMDGRRLARQIESAFVHAWQRWCARQDAAVHNDRGNALAVQGNVTSAIEAYRRAIALEPNYAEAHYNLGTALTRDGDLDQAVASLERAIAIRPTYAKAFRNRGNALREQGRLDEALASYDRAIALEPENARLGSNRLFALHFHPASTASTLYEEHRKWNERHATPFRALIPRHDNVRDLQRRLRIGYVSGDFRQHPVARFMLPLLKRRDQERFETFCYSNTRAADAMTHQLRQQCDHWRDIRQLDDEQAARLILEDCIDILVDLAMHTSDNRMLLFARKPAPVQVTYLAYCSTTGLETIDYRLTDVFLDPPEHSAAASNCYSERSFRLPETWWCYEPPVTAGDVGPLPALSAGYVTFGCLNNFAKVSRSALETFAMVLAAVPRSRLLLHCKVGSHRQTVLNVMAERGVDASRVEFVPMTSEPGYFGLYRRIDAALDPFPCAGGTTTCDALWMGVPVVTLAGKTAVGRAGVSILSNVGLREFIVRSRDEYVKCATDLAENPPRLQEIRAALRDLMLKSPLTDAPRLARNVESAYREMWRRWCEKSAPP